MVDSIGKFKYSAIHNAVMFHPEINLKAVRLFQRIHFLAANPKGCFEQNDGMAYHSSQPVSSVQANLKLLEDLGFIKRHSVKVTYKAAYSKEQKFNQRRWITVELDENILPDYVPITNSDKPNDSNSLDGGVPESLGMGVPVKHATIISKNYRSKNDIPKGIYLTSQGDVSNELKNSPVEDNQILPKNKYSRLSPKKKTTLSRTLEKPKSKVQPKKELSKEYLEIIRFWNEHIQNVKEYLDPRYKSPTKMQTNPDGTLKTDSKTLQTCVHNLDLLIKGKFKNGKKWNDEWLSLYNINDSTYQPTTGRKIKKTVEAFLTNFQENVGPSDKDKLPHSLEQFLYNSHSKTSWFLKTVADPPKTIRHPDKEAKPVDFDLCERLDNFLFKHELDDREWNDLVKGTNSILSYIDDLREHENWERVVGQWDASCYWSNGVAHEKIIDLYENWTEESGLKKFEHFHPGMIGTKGKQWYKFTRWLQAELEGCYVNELDEFLFPVHF